MTTDTHDESGAISPAGRFARMEASLDRIESKLDSKADLAVLTALAARVQIIEESGTPEAREALEAVRRLQQHITDTETGRSLTPVAQEYLNRFNQAIVDVAELKRNEITRQAVVEEQKKAIKDIADARYGSMRTMVAVFGIIQSCVVVVVTALSVLHVF